jgi:hypothetical protein
LNEKEPEKVEDLLEPDYEGMKKFKPIIDKFKDVFFGGEDHDFGCADMNKGKGRGRGAGATRGMAMGRGRGRGVKSPASLS